MAIRKAQYTVGDDTLHFETQDRSVNILDPNGKTLGTLNELAFQGKQIENVDFRSIVGSGLYKVKGLTGVPTTIPVDKTAILQIRSIGDPNKPDVIHYQIVGPNGVIADNTIAGGKETGWSSGGVTLETALQSISNTLGDVSLLKTSAKNLVSSINEVIGTNAITDKSIVDLSKKFTDHNHDKAYLGLNGGTLNGNLLFANNNGIRLKKSDGAEINFANIDDKDKVTMGDTSVHINLMSKDGLEVNGYKVFTSQNSGEGSGIDADKLDGIDSKQFARTDQTNEMYGNIHLHDAKGLIIDINEKDVEGGIVYKRANQTTIASIHSNVSGELLFYNNGTQNTKLKSNGTIYSKANIELDASSGEKAIIFKLNAADKGIGFYRNNSSKYIGVYDWQNDNFIVQFGSGKNMDAVSFNQAPYISGRRIFLQGGTPSGDIPAGSIWVS